MAPRDVHPDVFDADDPVASFAADLRAAAAATPGPAVNDELAHLFQVGQPSAVRPAAAAWRPQRQILRRVAIAAGALIVGTSGLGVAGALPGPVQRAVADVADVIGVQLPAPADDARPEPTPPATPSSTTPPSTVPTPENRPVDPSQPERPETPARPEQPSVFDPEADREAEKRRMAEERAEQGRAGEQSATTRSETADERTGDGEIPAGADDGRADGAEDDAVDEDANDSGAATAGRGGNQVPVPVGAPGGERPGS